MGEELKNQILVRNGIRPESDVKQKPSVLLCPRCDFVNPVDNKYCSKCIYPLTPRAFEEIKNNEEIRVRTLEEKYQNDIKLIREEMENKFQIILERINIMRLN